MTMISKRYAIEDLESKNAPLLHHLVGLSYTQTGYGSKIPTATMVKIPGSNRWRRVYACCYGNAATCYVLDRDNNWIVIY